MSSLASRRALLKALLGGTVALLPARGVVAAPPPGKARRVIFFYFPDGIPQGMWHAEGGETGFVLPACTQPLERFRDACVFTRGLSMGPTDSGSHPGGAKKLLTAVDGGHGESIDWYLARTFGADAPFRHVYLGAMATQNNATGDKWISYPSSGTTAAPEDSPNRAFARLFNQPVAPPSSAPGGPSALDTVLADLNDLRGRLGPVEKQKLDLHLEALRDLEIRTRTPAAGGLVGASCDAPKIDTSGVDDTQPYEPARFPAVLRAQMDLMVLAMACGLTKVGVIQASQHTSELIMSRFPGTPLFKPSFDMRSHQASHYGDRADPKFTEYVAQRRWFAEQLAYLLGELARRPEGEGTMLDYSLCLAVTEVCDGNAHLHDDMPFVLAGKAGGAVRAGRNMSYAGRRHGDLLLSLARACGDGITSFGDASSGVLPGLLTP